MNIVHINLFDSHGGAARIANDLAESARQQGHVVHTFAHRTTKRDEYVIPIPFFQEAHAQKLQDMERKKQLPNFYATAMLRVLQHPVFQAADIVHLHCIYSGYFSYLILPLLAVKPLIWTFHDPSVFTAHCVYPHKCEKWKTGYCQDCPMDEKLAKKPAREEWQHFKEDIFQLSNLTIVTPSRWMESMVRRSIFKEQDIRMIYNGIDTNIFQPQPKMDLRKKMGLPQNKKILLFVAHGGLSNEMKGGPYFLAALRELQQYYQDLLVLVVGESREVNIPELTIPIQFIPYIHSQQQMAEIYGVADVFISTSLTESFGLTVCEAMACGIPVVAFEVGGIAEMIDSGKDGLLVPEKDVTGLVKNIRLLLDGQVDVSQIGTRAYCGVQSNFELSEMCNKYLSLYEEK